MYSPFQGFEIRYVYATHKHGHGNGHGHGQVHVHRALHTEHRKRLRVTKQTVLRVFVIFKKIIANTCNTFLTQTLQDNDVSFISV